MASLALALPRPSAVSWLRASIASIGVFMQQPYQWAIPVPRSLLELFPPFLLAVPKKKVSHSRKSMRSANKGLKDKLNIVHCPACGHAKLAHHLCSNCYGELHRAWKTKRKVAEAEAAQPTP